MSCLRRSRPSLALSERSELASDGRAEKKGSGCLCWRGWSEAVTDETQAESTHKFSGRAGKKGVRGILKSVRSRVEFLTDPSHRISFLFTPRHCSWMNQIEIWFGTLRRKVTRWMSFTSLAALEDAIISFIEYYNETLAHPYKWTYTGKVLAA